MFIYISIFVGILLVLVVCGYFFLPDSQFSLSFSKRNFIITVVVLSAIFLYLLGFGIYNLKHPHEIVKIVHIDAEPHLVDGVEGEIMLLQDKEIHADKPYKTVIFTWEPVGKNLPFSFQHDGQKITKLLHISETRDPLYHQIKLSVGAKYMYTTTMTFTESGKFITTFGKGQNSLGSLTLNVEP